MHHSFYSDGNAEKISWVIETNNSIIKQNRKHADIYKNKVTKVQSKLIALHVGLFWGIGTFIIKNEDVVKIKVDEKIMYEYFMLNLKSKDQLIEKRIQFIKQLIKQRKLKTEFKIICPDNNLARKIIDAKELKTNSD